MAYIQQHITWGKFTAYMVLGSIIVNPGEKEYKKMYVE